MTINDILSLSAAGWTKADIMAMAQGQAPAQAQVLAPTQAQAPAQAPAPAPAPEPVQPPTPAPDLSQLMDRINAIDTKIQNSAMMWQPAPQQKDSSFDVLAKIINPKPPKKEG